MRITKFLLMATLAVAAISCTKDDDNPDAPKPTLTVEDLVSGNVNQDFTVLPGATLLFKWNALKTGGGANLRSFEIFQNGVNVQVPLPNTNLGEMLPITNLPNKYEDQYVDTISFSAGTNLGNTTYRFALTDEDGQLVERSMTVTVANAATPLAIEKTGRIYHVGGSLAGSYNLVADTSVMAAGSAANKDIQNSDVAGNPFTGSFKSANNSMFVKANTFDYANATEEDAIASFAAGTASANMTNPVVGDIYIVKLRGGADYAVVKITALDSNDNTCSCGNKGKMTFTYKKK